MERRLSDSSTLRLGFACSHTSTGSRRTAAGRKSADITEASVCQGEEAHLLSVRSVRAHRGANNPPMKIIPIIALTPQAPKGSKMADRPTLTDRYDPNEVSPA